MEDFMKKCELLDGHLRSEMSWWAELQLIRRGWRGRRRLSSWTVCEVTEH